MKGAVVGAGYAAASTTLAGCVDFFGPRPSGRIVFPRSPGYDSARQEFNTAFERFPLAIVFVRDATDVANSIRWARHHDVRIRMRSGRHSYEALSAADDSIVIDVSEMKGLELDEDTGVATVETGITDVELARALWDKGRMLPGGQRSELRFASAKRTSPFASTSSAERKLSTMRAGAHPSSAPSQRASIRRTSSTSRRASRRRSATTTDRRHDVSAERLSSRRRWLRACTPLHGVLPARSSALSGGHRSVPAE